MNSEQQIYVDRGLLVSVSLCREAACTVRITKGQASRLESLTSSCRKVLIESEMEVATDSMHGVFHEIPEDRMI